MKRVPEHTPTIEDKYAKKILAALDASVVKRKKYMAKKKVDRAIALKCRKKHTGLTAKISKTINLERL